MGTLPPVEAPAAVVLEPLTSVLAPGAGGRLPGCMDWQEAMHPGLAGVLGRIYFPRGGEAGECSLQGLLQKSAKAARKINSGEVAHPV